MSPSPTFTRAVLAFASMVPLAGCEIFQLAEQAGAKQVAVATLLAIPETTVPAEAIALDDRLEGFGFDGGLPLDGGLPGDLSLTLPATTISYIFFGERQGESLDSAPVGTPGATARLVQEGGGAWNLNDVGEGLYELPFDGGFTYVGGSTYQFEFQHAAETYVTEVKNAPPREFITQFHPDAGYVAIEAGSTFTFTRPDPALDEDRNIAFVNVFRVSGEGLSATPTWTNIPMDAQGLIKLVVAPNDWKRTTVVIPETAFPNRDETYLVMLLNAKIGLPKSKNLFSASAVIAGAADLGIVRTNK